MYSSAGDMELVEEFSWNKHQINMRFPKEERAIPPSMTVRLKMHEHMEAEHGNSL